jgi:hypothetical protein
MPGEVFVSADDLRTALEMIAEAIEDRSPREGRALLRLWEAIAPPEEAARMAGWGCTCGPTVPVDELIAVRGRSTRTVHLVALLPSGVILCGDRRLRFDRVSPAIAGDGPACPRCARRVADGVAERGRGA